LVLPFWYRLTWVVPEKGPLNGCACVCFGTLWFAVRDVIRTATSAAADADSEVAGTRLGGIDLEHGLERRQDSVLDARTRHLDQACRRRPDWERTSCSFGFDFSQSINQYQSGGQLVDGSVAEWLACWTQAHMGPGSNRSLDAVG